MGSQSLHTLGFWTALLFVAAGVALLGYRLRARSQRRHEAWRLVCLRLELVAKPGAEGVATGQLKGVGFGLRDTGSRWFLELPLAEPLLPPDAVLLSAKERRPWLRFRLSRLPEDFSAPAPHPLAWHSDRGWLASTAEASAPFLEEATRAAQAHAPLRVEPHLLVHALRADTVLSVEEVRAAVGALHATAQRWLAAVRMHGLPRVSFAPPKPSAGSMLNEVLARYHPWRCLLFFNGTVPLIAGALAWNGYWLGMALLTVLLFLVDASREKSHALIPGAALVSTGLLLWLWTRGAYLPDEASTRQGVLLAWEVLNAVWLVPLLLPALAEWGREVYRARLAP